MNVPNQSTQTGSELEQRNQGRARVRLAVFIVLSIHVVGLMALLMQGCKREESPPQAEPTNAPPVFEPTLTPPVDTNVPSVAPSVTQPVPVETTPPAAATPPAGTEYTVQAGDTFYSIGKKFGVGYLAIEAANPGVDPKKLKPGQKIQIPAPAGGATAPASPGNAAGTAAEGNGIVYTVKSGDTLTKIAAEFGVTVKAIRAANNLTTDRIKVGQKLTIPAKTTAPAAPAGAAPGVPPPATVPGTPPGQ